ncbi:MAG: A/G-specific adenine glycosylase [Gammaproteobacteria bacterium]|nr:A/G-specific adenine glycosylase [Gammaproteobacteria bacterium]
MTHEHQQFYDTIVTYYREHGRHTLPWRIDMSPYKVLVSEIMLQQTQVERVIPFFERWMTEFPTWKDLAHAQQSRVLTLWKGLGYNSRALRLQKLAQIVTTEYNQQLPHDFKELCALPGIGNYTAAAVRAFAFNLYSPLIETNVRRVFIHHFFSDQENVKDCDILHIINEIGEVENPRLWYAALMDYGSTLPKVIKTNPNRKSKHYSKQSKFEGSNRQIRGAILDILLKAPKHRIGKSSLIKKIDSGLGYTNQETRYGKIINDLINEGFIIADKRSYILK